jgi:hypothetical protein
MVGGIRHVATYLAASGAGWLEAAPETESVGADILIVNKDRVRSEKSAWPTGHRVEYLLLTRAPREGLQARSSTSLRG